MEDRTFAWVTFLLFIVAFVANLIPRPVPPIAWDRCNTVPLTSQDGTINVVFACHKDSIIVKLRDVPPLGMIQPGAGSTPQAIPRQPGQRRGG